MPCQKLPEIFNTMCCYFFNFVAETKALWSKLRNIFFTYLYIWIWKHLVSINVVTEFMIKVLLDYVAKLMRSHECRLILVSLDNKVWKVFKGCKIYLAFFFVWPKIITIRHACRSHKLCFFLDTRLHTRI